ISSLRASTAKIPRLAALARDDDGVVVHTTDSLRSLGMTMVLSFIRRSRCGPCFTSLHASQPLRPTPSTLPEDAASTFRTKSGPDHTSQEENAVKNLLAHYILSQI
ncbi:MAG: hypothetical protein ABF653_05980, partial [Bifidobacterium aquikefiri]|uniref:hypothetical protein n=3 Tax=Bifidobacterium aquikefiri TaxID=1653207 RepID=UPI0039E7AF7D